MKAITIQKPPDISWDCPHPCFQLQTLCFADLSHSFWPSNTTTPHVGLYRLNFCHTVTDLQSYYSLADVPTHIQKTQLQTNWHSIEPPVSSCSETWLPCIDLDLHKMGWSRLTDHNFLCTHDKVLLTLRKPLRLNTITKQIQISVQ